MSWTYNTESRNRQPYFEDYRKKNREKLRAYKKKWKEERKAKEHGLSPEEANSHGIRVSIPK